ncbi:MAG: hypothetical protein MUF42_16215 [Cytophagaceae bacterium]|jgi:hypothetical protein|nr:hypothetical protein [Cytophagaceae bacterium]
MVDYIHLEEIAREFLNSNEFDIPIAAPGPDQNNFLTFLRSKLTDYSNSTKGLKIATSHDQNLHDEVTEFCEKLSLSLEQYFNGRVYDSSKTFWDSLNKIHKTARPDVSFPQIGPIKIRVEQTHEALSE